MILDFHTDAKDYKYIHSWMTVALENKIPGATIINNIRENDFTDGKAIVYRENNNAEAFLVYSRSNRKVEIYLLALNPLYHHKGIGTRFLADVIKSFRKKRILVIDAYKPSNKGLRMVKKLGFKKLEVPHEENMWMNLYIGQECRKQNKKAKRRLVLWKGYNSNNEPFMSWSLNFNRCKKPIFAYAYKDWTLGIIENGEKIYSAPVKHCSGVDDEIAYGYIYITKDILYKKEGNEFG